MTLTWGAIVVAAGRGTRFGRPKQFVELCGRPMVEWSLRLFAAMPEVAELVVVTEAEWCTPMRALLDGFAQADCATVVQGGATRQQSMYAGLRALSSRCDAVFVHDGARPLVRAEDIRTAMRHVRPACGAVLATAVVDTVKVVDTTTMTVRETPDRATLWAAQTPQFAMRADLERAHDAAVAAGVDCTDDVALLERIGIRVVVVPSSSDNFKVTHPADVVRAETLLRERYALGELG